MHLKRKWALYLSLLPLLLSVTASTQDTCTNQSPRNVNDRFNSPEAAPYNYVSRTPLVIPTTNPQWPEAVYYQKRALHRCDQHYHAPVENVQGCPGEKEPPSGSEPIPGEGKWVEIHTVYALGVKNDGECSDHLDHNLACCTAPPFVVIAYNAKIGPNATPIEPVIKPPTPSVNLVSEWSGSTTGKDDATNCKPIPAEWNFALGCGFTVPHNQLSIFHEAHPARALQTGNLISRDLTLAGANASICKDVNTAPIRDNSEAQRVCPGVCAGTGTTTTFNGQWQNRASPEPHAVCGCCTPSRPQ